ncbi:MAG TPA: hypothetical protein PK777_08660 [Thermoguttaceae bacterium]|nr:hypothetical protein [Thermoguttaceae bacterium]
MRFFAQGLVVPLLVFVLLIAEAAGGENQVVWIGQMDPGDRLEIWTAEHVVCLELIDPEAGEAQAAVSRDGVHFGPTERVYLLGATAGRHSEGLMVVRMGCIEVGKRLELAVGDLEPGHRRLTAPVEEIRIRKSAHTSLP